MQAPRNRGPSHKEVLSVKRNGLKPERYDDVGSSDCPAGLYAAMAQHLPEKLAHAPREKKIEYINSVLAVYRPTEQDKRRRQYRETILRAYKPLHTHLFSLDSKAFFVPSFLEAIEKGTEEALHSILREEMPGVYSFDMLQPAFCNYLLEELGHFEAWAAQKEIKIMRPNTMNNHGAVLDDIGMEAMLDELMKTYLGPLTAILFPEVGGASLDSHHGFLVEYSTEKDKDLGFHVDDSEVSLNVCLGKEFEGGGLFFRGVRCERHVNEEASPDESADYRHLPGKAILHAGRHRHGARPITAGERVNMIVWCRSSVFREQRKYLKDCSRWCVDCKKQGDSRKEQRVAKHLAALESG